MASKAIKVFLSPDEHVRIMADAARPNRGLPRFTYSAEVIRGTERTHLVSPT